MAKSKKKTTATSYCVKCKVHTPDSGEITHQTTKNNRTLRKVACGQCGIKKCKFVKSE